MLTSLKGVGAFPLWAVSVRSRPAPGHFETVLRFQHAMVGPQRLVLALVGSQQLLPALVGPQRLEAALVGSRRLLPALVGPCVLLHALADVQEAGRT